MFASFGLVLAVMILLVREKPRPRPSSLGAHRTLSAPLAPSRPDTPRIVASTPQVAMPETAPTEVPPAVLPDVRTRRGGTAGLPPGGEAQRRIRKEREDMALLRKEMEKRLNEQLAARDQRIDKLARQCAELEPGEAAGILADLDAATVGSILGRMDRPRAVAIAAVLQRMGHPGALALP
jgi:hypothetical protein